MTSIDSRVSRFQAALQIPTISELQGDERTKTFGKLHELMRKSFPNVFARATVEKPHDQTLMVTIPGSDPSLKPNVIIAHQDVVPVKGQVWQHDPFAADIVDGAIIARGSIDDKAHLFATLEAAEALLASGKKPLRTLVLALSDDEEIIGSGAPACAKLVKDRYGSVESVFDEGGFLVPAGFLPNVPKPAALVATGEKGFLSLELTATGVSGHSSIPEPNSAIDQINAALTAIQSHPFAPALTQPSRDFLRAIAPYQGSFEKTFLDAAAGVKSAENLVLGAMIAQPTSAAMVRVTTAPVALHSDSGADNVTPGVAKAVINMRLLPGVTIADATAQIKTLVGPGITITTHGNSDEAPPISSIDSAGYKHMAATVAKVYPDAIVVPLLTTGASDSRAFAGFANSVSRCIPARVTAALFASLHGANESIGVQAYIDLIQFQTALINEANGFR